ncbi:MAG: DUF1566 domain-containing protein [Bryobacteraceae bacterium]
MLPATTWIVLQLLVLTFAWFGTAVEQRSEPNKSADRKPGEMPFKDNGDGTVTQKTTNLNWQKDDDGKQRSWNAAVGYCQALSLEGNSGWRLPSLTELLSLWKGVGTKSDIRKTYFPSMKSSGELYPGIIAPYWSATPVSIQGADGAAFVTFNDGSSHVGTKDFFSFYSRCVRTGKN